MEAARVWNVCMETHKAARSTHAPWPGQRELELATKGRFALNAQATRHHGHGQALIVIGRGTRPPGLSLTFYEH
jgi:hypothetical protein